MLPVMHVSSASNDPFLVIGGYPLLRHIENAANRHTLKEIQEIFQDYIDSIDVKTPGEMEFDFEAKHSDKLVRP